MQITANSPSTAKATPHPTESQWTSDIQRQTTHGALTVVDDPRESDALREAFHRPAGHQDAVLASEGDLPQAPASEGEPASPDEATLADMAERLFLAMSTSEDLFAGEELRNAQDDQIEKLKVLFEAVLKGGNLDFAVTLFASLEGAQSNKIMTGLLEHMNALNQERRDFASQIAGLDPKAPDYTSKLTDLQTRVTSIGTDLAMLQTFLQEAASSKRQAEEFASNMLSQSNRTAQSIIQNIGR